jgi:sortase (surface protein transpeptidase)
MRARRRRRRLVTALAGAGLLAVGGLLLVLHRTPAPALDTASQDVRDLPLPGRLALDEALEVQRRPATTQPLRKQEPRPVRLTIPAIGVATPIIRLGLNSDHTVQTPKSFHVAGWFEPGPEPGELGAALIVGHVDSKNGPGVFFHLRALRRGDLIRVKLADGRSLPFIVTSSRDVSKQHFPEALVYRRTKRPTLRLVTCGGLFDPSTGHYLSNHIVFAWLLGKP